MRTSLNSNYLLFKHAEMLDFAGPFNILGYCGAANIIAAEAGPVDMMPSGQLIASHDLASAPDADVIIVPGGVGQDEAMKDERVLAYLRAEHEKGTIITSVCTGALVLAAAGLLEGKRATTHWMARGELGRMGATAVEDRLVDEGQIITAAGVSAGIDMAIHLVAREMGDDLAKSITLGVEYDPEPPFDTGSPEKAPAETVANIRANFRYEP